MRAREETQGTANTKTQEEGRLKYMRKVGTGGNNRGQELTEEENDRIIQNKSLKMQDKKHTKGF